MAAMVSKNDNKMIYIYIIPVANGIIIMVSF